MAYIEKGDLSPNFSVNGKILDWIGLLSCYHSFTVIYRHLMKGVIMALISLTPD